MEEEPTAEGNGRADVERPIRVVVADDHPLYRAALTESLADLPRCEVVGVATDGREALRLIREHAPDVAVLDMRMPELDGRDVLGRLRESDSRTRVLFVSEYRSGEIVLQALTAGGAGYLSKTADAEAIRTAVVRVARGESVLPGDVGGDLVSALHDRSHVGPRLSERELLVLTHIAAGRTAAAIAGELYLAVPTVKTHIQNLYGKLGVNDRGAAVAEGMRRGLLD